MLHYYPMSTIVDGQGINITVQSYRDILDFGLVACRELVPDLEDLADLLVEEITVLAKAVDAGRGGGGVPAAAEGGRHPTASEVAASTPTARPTDRRHHLALLPIEPTGPDPPSRGRELPLEDLHGAGQRQRLGAELDRLRDLVAGDPLPGPGLDVRFGDRHARVGTTMASTASPHWSDGMPMTATCATAGWPAMAFSTSAEYTFSPPVTIMSLTRSTR